MFSWNSTSGTDIFKSYEFASRIINRITSFFQSWVFCAKNKRIKIQLSIYFFYVNTGLLLVDRKFRAFAISGLV